MSRSALYTVIITVICPPLGLLCSLFFIGRREDNSKLYFLCIAWAFGVFAYCYEPTTVSDLVRYNYSVDALKDMNFMEALTVSSYGQKYLYSFVMICWSISKIGNYRLLPAISTFCVYYIGLTVIRKTWIEYPCKRGKMISIISFLLLMLSFYSIVNNVRNVCAFAMISYAIYRDCYEKKKNVFTYFLYIFPLFLHTSAIVLIFVRIILRLTGRIKTVVIASVLIVPAILNFLASRFGGINGSNIAIRMILGAINSGNDYFEHANSTWAIVAQNSGSIRLTKVLTLTYCVLFVAYTLAVQKKLKKDERISTIKIKDTILYCDYIFYVTLLALSCTTMVMPEYWRFAAIVILIGGFTMLVGNYVCEESLIHRLTSKISFMLALPCFVITVRNLVQYSDFPTMIIRSFICNPLALSVLSLMGKTIDFITT